MRFRLWAAATALCAAIAAPAGSRAGVETPAAPPTGWQGGCTATSCLYRRAAAEGDTALLIARRAGAAGLSIGFAFPGARPDRDRPAALSLDGQPIATLLPGRDLRPVETADESWIVAAPPLARLAAQLGQGGLLRLSYLDVLGAPHDASFDLGGGGEIVAALAVGPVANPATVAPTPQSNLALPARIDEIRRLGVPARLAQLHAAMTTCEALDSPRLAGRAALIAELSPTAILYALPCAAGRDTVLSQLWVIETGEIGGITPQHFALYQPSLGWIGTDRLADVAFAAGRLTAHAAPATGCAWAAAWRWRGTTFGLDELTLTACPGKRGGPTRIFPGK